MENEIISIKNIVKQYRLGQIGGGTLKGDLQSWWAKVIGKEDPNAIIGEEQKGQKGEFFRALNGVNFSVNAGDRIGLIGHNGAGKSTLLKLISRVTAPTSGRIEYSGRIASMLEVGTGFHPELTGRENIYLNGAILGMTKEEITRKIDDIVRFAELEKFIDTPIKRYSSGMKVKLGFSVAAHLDAEIMIMDEVLAVGDMEFQQKCIDKMNHLSKEEGRTILYVSHNMNTIRALCNRCVVLSKGKVLFDGEVEEGISVYMKRNMDDYALRYDLNKVPRSYHFGKKLKVHSFEFLDTDSFVYEIGQPVHFNLEMLSSESHEGISLNLKVMSDKGEILGMAMSKKFNINKGKLKEIAFSFETSNLANGKYHLGIEVVKIDENGNYLAYDSVPPVVLIELTNAYAHGICWTKEYYGNILFKSLEQI